MENKFKNIKIILEPGIVVEFTGKYRRDLEKPNWHYYEEYNGTIQHFRKARMIAVIEGESSARVNTF